MNLWRPTSIVHPENKIIANKIKVGSSAVFYSSPIIWNLIKKNIVMSYDNPPPKKKTHKPHPITLHKLSQFHCNESDNSCKKKWTNANKINEDEFQMRLR